MITMQELTQRFKPILARTIDTKEPTENGIKIPYKNIARVCIEFAPGESYSFFGSAKECALSLWRINLMWQLAKKGVPIHVLSGGQEFHKDFYDLLCLETDVPGWHLENGRLEAKEYQALCNALPTVENYPITWHTDDRVDFANIPAVCFKTITLKEWQAGEAIMLASEVQNQGMVLFLFVNLPENVPVSWLSLYTREHIVMLEDQSTYVGLVQFVARESFDLRAHRKDLCITLNKTNFLSKDSCYFDFERETGKITELA